MTLERWRQIEELYQAACESRPEERQALLAQATPELRGKVEAMLAQDASGGKILDRPAAELLEESAVNELAAGVLLGPYRIEGLIGAGGMGRVYKATDTRLGRPVAIKVAQERFSDRFEREARVIATLNHPNICTLYDIGTNYLVMEYIEGEPVKGPLPLEQALANAVQILDALEAAHAKGIVHRDLKPANILRTKSGVKLLDFGLAKQMREAPGPDGEVRTLSLTGTGALMGTPAYMAPEQWEGKPADVRSDVYAFGCVLYEMLTGKRTGADRAPVKPAALEAVLAKCLARNPADRFQSVAEVRPQLREKPPPVKWKYVTAAGIVVVLGLAAGGWLYRARPVHALSDTDTVVLAEFTNSTGDSAFDVTLQQALAADLQESPFFSILPNQTLNATLKLMSRKPGVPLTEDIAREVCQRTGSKAYFGGSIAGLGSRYLIGLKAVNCQTGETLAQAGREANRKDDVLSALDKAANKLREKVGEPLASIQKSDLGPFARQASTPSLEAWQSYVKGRQEDLFDPAGGELFRRAIELDPNFAMAYLSLGMNQLGMGEESLAEESMTKAFELRDHASKWERHAIESRYYLTAIGDLVKAQGVYEAWVADYPRSFASFDSIDIAGELGQFQKAVQLSRSLVQLYPGDGSAVCALANAYALSNLLDEARSASEEYVKQQHDDDECAHAMLFSLAFLKNDDVGMAKQLDWANRQQLEDDDFLAMQTNFAAYHGQLEKAREGSRRWIVAAQGKNRKELAAYGEAAAALREALLGNRAEAKERAQDALTLSRGKKPEYMAALTYALAGDIGRSRELAQDLGRRFPQDTIVQFHWLPTVRALIELYQRNPTNAIQVLQAASPYELGAVYGALWPVYARGLAHLALHKGVEAAVEFQKILDHPGLITDGDLNTQLIDALAHVGLARAYALQGDSVKARAAYQDFFTIWKDADPGIPVLKEAQAEYKKLQ